MSTVTTSRTLRPDVYLTACAVGIARYDYRRARNINSLDQYDDDERRTPYDHLRAEMLGACGELVGCGHIGARWPAQVGATDPDELIEPDLTYRGVRYEFRTTTYGSGHLQLKRSDPVDVWVLIVADAPTFHIVGCITAALGKRPHYLKSPTGRPSSSWWVPQQDLLHLPAGGLSRPDIRKLDTEGATA